MTQKFLFKFHHLSSGIVAPIVCAMFVLVSVPAQPADFGGLFKSLAGQTSGDRSNVDQTLVKMSQKMNRSMPQTVDRDTRLENVSAEPGQELAYHYTLTNMRSKEIDTANFYRILRPVLQKRVCAADDMKMFFRNRVTVAYAYRGKDGNDIGKLAFSPKDCGYPS